MTGCSSISTLRSGEEEVCGLSSTGRASMGSVEVGVVGGEEERAPFVTCSVEGPFVSSVSFDTFIIYLQSGAASSSFVVSRPTRRLRGDTEQ